MSENIWIDDFLNICSLPKIDILEYLLKTPEYVDTVTISNNLHMQVSEVYQHLQSLAEDGFIILKKMGKRGQEKRYWKVVHNFEISLKSINGQISFQKSINKKREINFQNISVNSKNESESRYKERTELKYSLNFLEEVVLIALYGNWFITFVDKLSFPYTDFMTQIQRLQLGLEGFCVLLLVTTLSLYFINRKQRSDKIWFIHLGLIIIVISLEAILDPTFVSIKTLTFSTIGLMFWSLIQWVDDFKDRFKL